MPQIKALLKLSVIVPCYNEEEGLFELHRRVTGVCRQYIGKAYEFILVNDGSRDATWSKMLVLAERDKHVVAVNLSRNHGHQIALSAGLQLSRGELIFTLDADLQHPPELLPKILTRIKEGCDVVFGQRMTIEGETWFKKFSSTLFYQFINRISNVSITENAGDFRLMTRQVVDVLNRMPEQHRFIRGMISWIGMRQEALPYKQPPRYAGKSKYTIPKMIRFALDAITGFSVRPLRAASYCGFGFSIITFFWASYVILNYFLGNTIKGWASLATIILGLGSVQLFVIGILGEYLGRLYVESKNRPLFVIQEVFCSSEHSHKILTTETYYDV